MEQAIDGVLRHGRESLQASRGRLGQSNHQETSGGATNELSGCTFEILLERGHEHQKDNQKVISPSLTVLTRRKRIFNLSVEAFNDSIRRRLIRSCAYMASTK